MYTTHICRWFYLTNKVWFWLYILCQGPFAWRLVRSSSILPRLAYGSCSSGHADHHAISVSGPNERSVSSTIGSSQDVSQDLLRLCEASSSGPAESNCHHSKCAYLERQAILRLSKSLFPFKELWTCNPFQKGAAGGHRRLGCDDLGNGCFGQVIQKAYAHRAFSP